MKPYGPFPLESNQALNPDKFSKYRSNVYYRDYAREKSKGIYAQQDPLISQAAQYGPGWGAAAYFGVRAAHDIGRRAFGANFGIDEAYRATRLLEHTLPVFRIPLRVMQVGDIMSPFVSDRQLRFKYGADDLFSVTKQGKTWRRQFQPLADLILQQNKGLGADQLIDLVSSQGGINFTKRGKVYGDIMAGGSKLASNVFIMEQPSSRNSAVAALWESSKRAVQVYSALDPNSKTVDAIHRLSRGLVGRDKIARGLGLARGIGGGLLNEYVNSMQRFLKSPVPFLDSLLASEETVSFLGKAGDRDLTQKSLSAFLGIGDLRRQETIPFGKMPAWMRPYVSSDKWTKSSSRMIAALAAKGSIYTIGLPAAFMAADNLRRKFDTFGSGLISTPLFAAMGVGAASLLLPKSQVRTKGIAGKLGATNAQLVGAGLGALVGGLNVFDKGFSAGVGALYSRYRIMASGMWDSIGGTGAVERQEALFPGITNPMTAAGFAMTGGIMGYLHREIGTLRGMAMPLGYQKSFYSNITPRVNDAMTAVQQASKIMATVSEQGLSDSQQAVVKKAQEKFRSVFDDYGKVHPPSYLAATGEATRILAGQMQRGVPRSQAGLLAMMMKARMDLMPEGDAFVHRMGTDVGRRDLAGSLYQYSEELASTLERHSLDEVGELLGKRAKATTWLKRTIKSPRPGFWRGALRGGVAFTGISMLGALAAGPMGGNFTPADFLPGWIIRATGGGQAPSEARKVFTGEEEVGIRKARWWSMGRTPYEGTKIDYFRKHRAVLMQSDAKDNALYGSYEEKVAYDPVLHPLRAIFDDEFKYHREKRMSQISPTPLTARMFTDVPIVGEVLASTIGEVIKPTQAIRPSEWMTPRTGGDASPGTFMSGGFTPVQAPPYHGQEQAMKPAPAVPSLGGSLAYQAQLPSSVAYATKWTFERMSEQAGLKGFIVNTMAESFGYQTRTYKPVVESGDRLFSARTSFWSLNVGDPFGTTEAARRYLTRDRNSYYNPLKNMAPSWLPSQNFYRDFKHGNYFMKVSEGWLRLPGAGYETLNPELKGVNPEDYPLAHKYKILSDVAYQSDEWKYVKEQVVQAVQAGRLDRGSMDLVAKTNRQIRQRSQSKRTYRKYQFDERRLKKVKLHITGVFDDGTFAVAEFGKRPVKLGGVNVTMAALAREAMKRHNYKTQAEAARAAQESKARIVQALKANLKPGSVIEAYVPGSETDQFGGSTSEVYIKGLSEKVKALGGEVQSGNAFAPTVQYNQAQQALGRAWELFTHNADLPITPAAALNAILPFQPQAKFIQRLSPTELYARTRVYGREIQMWQRYKEDFIDSAVNETWAKVAGDFIPAKVKHRRQLQEHFDKLTWLKYYVLEREAKKAGKDDLAQQFGEKKRQTAFGVDPYRGYQNLYRAIPRTDKDFYREFIKENDETERRRILDLVPEYTKHIYVAQWHQKDIQALQKKIEAGVASNEEKKNLYALYNMRRVEGMNWSQNLQREYEAQTAGGREASYADWMRSKMLKRYFQAYKMPEANWVAFNPQVDLEDVKLKEAQAEGIDIHDIGLWESQEVTIESKPYVEEALSELRDWRSQTGMSGEEIQRQLRQMSLAARNYISTVPTPRQNKMMIQAPDTRAHDIRSILLGYGDI